MNCVVKGTAYTLVNAPDMLLHNGTTQTTQKITNPDGEYLKKLPNHLRKFEDVVNYLPNQVYIGNKTPEDLAKLEMPWHNKLLSGADRFGKFGEIMPQDEFYLLMQAMDVFDLVKLEKNFVGKVKPAFEKHPLMEADMVARIKEGVDKSEIERFVNDEHAEALYHNNELIGYVKKAHDIDVNLSAHVIHENLVSKATSVLSLLNLVKVAGINKDEVDYVIDCSEEACGDMNQRGGGNFAKAAAEMVGFNKATGSDVRGFCAAPAHALVVAASLVSAGTFKNVVVTAGGSTAKLGMNGTNHVDKDMPALEDVLGGFAVLISENDGVNPVINLDIIGRHTVGTGSAPQAVISSLVSDPLERAGLKITDVDKFSPEMQNPDVTVPAGAGDVPLANYKMIGALAVKRGDIEKADLAGFTKKHGMSGWAPTQGHIPSGVPYVGFAREDIMAGKIKNAMIVGKGSLFLGRMTNLFDGVSFIMEANKGVAGREAGVSEEEVKQLIAKAMKEFASSLMSE